MRSDDERNHKSISIEGELENWRKINSKWKISRQKFFLMRNVILMWSPKKTLNDFYSCKQEETFCLQKWLIFCTNSFRARRAAAKLCGLKSLKDKQILYLHQKLYESIPEIFFRAARKSPLVYIGSSHKILSLIDSSRLKRCWRH